MVVLLYFKLLLMSVKYLIGYSSSKKTSVGRENFKLKLEKLHSTVALSVVRLRRDGVTLNFPKT